MLILQTQVNVNKYFEKECVLMNFLSLSLTLLALLLVTILLFYFDERFARKYKRKLKKNKGLHKKSN